MLPLNSFDETTLRTVDYYNNNAKDFFDRSVNQDMDALYAPFLELLPPNARILDAGCGSGRDTHNFLARGYRVTAFDASERLTELAKEWAGQNILTMSFQEVNFQAEFDGVWACTSLLHLPKHQLEDAIRRLAKAVEKGGILYMSFLYGQGETERDGRHYSNFEEASFEALFLGHNELKILRIWQSPGVRPGRENERLLNALIRRDA